MWGAPHLPYAVGVALSAIIAGMAFTAATRGPLALRLTVTGIAVAWSTQVEFATVDGHLPGDGRGRITGQEQRRASDLLGGCEPRHAD